MQLEMLVPLPHAAPIDAGKTGCSLENSFSVSKSGVGWLPIKCARHRYPFFPAPPSLHPLSTFLIHSRLHSFVLAVSAACHPFPLSTQIASQDQDQDQGNPRCSTSLPGEPSSLVVPGTALGRQPTLHCSLIISCAFITHLLTHSISVLLVQSFIHSTMPALIHSGSS